MLHPVYLTQKYHYLLPYSLSFKGDEGDVLNLWVYFHFHLLEPKTLGNVGKDKYGVIYSDHVMSNCKHTLLSKTEVFSTKY